MNERVLALFSTHLKPLTKISNVEKKQFLPNHESANEEAEMVKNRTVSLYLALKSERVDKRNARSKVELVDGTDIVKLIKNMGLNFSYLGHSYEKCKCLNGLEAMYLLETNRLEILHKSVPLSTQDCYNIFLDSDVALRKYRIYRKLAVDGFKLTLFKYWSIKKEENPKVKRIKYDESEETPERYAENSNILNTFNRLRQNAPKQSVETVSLDCDYKMYYPSNSKKDESDLDIYVHTSADFNSKYGFLNNKVLFGLVTPNSTAFYRIGKVKIPII